MPWRETDAMKERTQLVLEWEKRWNANEGVVNVSELCREFGISRDCGYKWIKRYVAANRDVRAVEERSRRPLHSPTATDDNTQALVVRARKRHPRWGPRKLRAWLQERLPGVAFPSASAFAAILKRHGLVSPAKCRRPVGPDPRVSLPFAECDAPNRVWCVDFKGWFLSDNGPPFASSGAAGRTELSVWWLEFGIRLERIASGEPQQNGRHERMHRTLKADVSPQGNMRRQQSVFDVWRRMFNDERPHEALGLRPPAKIYGPSSRRYPRALLKFKPSRWNHSAEVDKQGFIRFLGRKVFVSSAVRCPCTNTAVKSGKIGNTSRHRSRKTRGRR